MMKNYLRGDSLVNRCGLVNLLFLVVCQLGFAQKIDPKLILPIGHTGNVYSAIFSPDGKSIVTACGDKTAKIWSASSGKLLHNLEGHTNWVNSPNFSPDGKSIVTASIDKTAKIWDASSGKLLHSLIGHRAGVYSATFSPDGKTIVTASGDKTAKIWEASSGKLLHTLKGHTDRVNSATFSPDGKSIVTSSNDGIVKIWEASSGKLFHSLEGHTNWVNSSTFSPDGKSIITASNDGTAKIWEAATGKLLHSLEGYENSFRSATYSPDGKSIVTSSNDGIVNIWEASSGKLLYTLTGHHSEDVNLPTFSPDGKSIVSASNDGIAKIWDASSGKLLHSLEGHTNWVNSVTFSPDGKSIVTASGDKTAKIWEASSGKLLHSLEGHTNSVRSATFSPDGKSIVTTSYDKTAKIWHVASGKLLNSLEGHTKDVNSSAFSRDGKSIVTASGDKTAKIWEAATGKLLHTLKGHTKDINSATFSPDGKSIVTASGDNTAKIWDTSSGKLLQSLEGHENSVRSATFSPDGKTIVTASIDKTARIWEASSGKLLHTLEGHTDYVLSAAFSPDGKSIVTASGDKTAKIWGASSGKLLHTLTGHSKWVYSATFSPDGKNIFTASHDQTTKIWKAASGKLLKSMHLNGDFKDINFENKTLISHNNSKLTLWDIDAGKELYSMIAIDSSDYLVIDPYGRYDGTPAARNLLYFVCDLDIIELNQVKNALYVPNLVNRIMRGDEINYPKLSELNICDLFPEIEQIESTRDYQYKITQRGSPVEFIEVYINDKKVYRIPASELKKEGNIYLLQLAAKEVEQHFIGGQKNEVKVVGVVKDESLELRSRGVKSIMSAKEESTAPPKLYGVFIGLKEYSDPNLNLSFAAKDAQDLQKAFQLGAEKLLGKENVFTYLLHNDFSKEYDKTPNRENIKSTIAEIAKQAQPQDVILFFFAGHGEMIGEKEKVFTLLTEESTMLNRTGVTTNDILSWFSYDGPFKMLANKTIFILDACNSGQATKELMAMARNDDESRRIRQVEDLKDKSGMFIFTASAANQAAYEMPQYQQGLMTYSLLHTLKNDPTVLDDGAFLNLSKWFLQSEEYLKNMVKRYGLDQQAQPFGTANVRIAQIDEDVKESIQLVGEKLMVVCGNVLNKNGFKDNLNIRDQLEERLLSNNQRGESSVIFSTQKVYGALEIEVIYEADKDNYVKEVTLEIIKNGEVVFKKQYKNIEKHLLIEALIRDISTASLKD
jgi:WD40 repeat protein